MTDTSGPTFYAPLGKWDRDSQSWKTSEATSLWALTLSSLTLPTWGGLHDGELYEHPTPELLTSGLDSSSLPTPTGDDANNVTRASGQYQSLTRTVMTSLLPTPAVNDMGEGKTLEWWDDWAPRQKSSDGRPAPHGKSLAIEAMRLLPTPTVQQGRNETSGRQPGSQHHDGKTLMDWAWEISEWPGATTAPPSPDGSTSRDDPHPHLLSLEGLAHPA
jgi:hypothetical protein